jgi:acetyl esterase/lipase
MRTVLIAILLLSASPGDRNFHPITDIQYCTGGGQPLLMDVFIPEHRLRSPSPAVLWLHGGVQAVSSWYGPTDFTVGAMEFEHHTGRAVIKLFRATLEQKPEDYSCASPITYVSAASPPLLLAHGDKDEMVPYDQALRMKRRYESHGLTVEFISVRNAGHDFAAVGDRPISPSIEEIHQRTIEFFKQQLLR